MWAATLLNDQVRLFTNQHFAGTVAIYPAFAWPGRVVSD